MRDFWRKKAKGLARLVGFVLAFSVFAFNFTDGMIAVRELPGALFSRENGFRSFGSVRVSSSGDETLSSSRAECALFGLIPLKSAAVYPAERRYAYPGGRAVGITIHTDGVLVVGFGEVENAKGRPCCPAKAAGLRPGDFIMKVNGRKVFTSEELLLALNAAEGSAEIEALRGGRKLVFTVDTEKSGDTARIGAWVRDSTLGVGTLSFVMKDTLMAACLGHSVSDADTGALLSVRSGSISEAAVLGVTRARSGIPGELRGTFSSESRVLGSITLNSPLGVFGTVAKSALSPAAEALPVAFPTEVHEGEAYIIAELGGEGPKPYSCRIIRVSRQDKPAEKGLVIEITDEALLNMAGGIVQGMSGSPIIQDGMLAGAVTHVFVNDPAKGYGSYAFWMCEAGEKSLP